MDPEIYRHFRTVQGILPPLIPVDEQPIETQEQQRRPDSNWSVYSPNITRGNLDSVQNLNDPRSHVGWKEGASSEERSSEQSGYMSSTHEQPWMWRGYFDKEDEATPGQTDHTSPISSYPHPNLSLPHPSLSLDFRMSVTLNPKISVGPTPFGHRNWISFTGGSWSGSWGAGIVLPGGQDSQLIIPNGSARLETNYLLQTHDSPPAHISIKTYGWRTGPPEVLAQLSEPTMADKVDPNSYKFRLFIEMETGDERYRDTINCGMWIGSGMRKGAEVIYDAYRVS